MKKVAKKKYFCPKCKRNWVSEEWADPEWFASITTLLCKEHTVHGDIYVVNQPGWVNAAKIDPSKMDANLETKATEYMLSERQKEMRVSRRSRDWEQGRKKSIMDYKSTWVKRGRKTRDLPKL